ncbi:hypothetical protein C8Q79DRAFT_247036 [Trametes meyenii]|nr:hypothetical protein C8Q79DRAFT_247036 [Trametes meyenii]
MALGSASNGVPGSHSLPASLHDAPPMPALGYRGTRPPAPSTPGQYSPYGIASSVHTPSSGSLASVGYRNRQPSYEYSDASPTDTSSWHLPSPSPAPHTPNSLRGTSIPPSVRSEPSPFLGLMIGDFSPDMAPLGKFIDAVFSLALRSLSAQTRRVKSCPRSLRTSSSRTPRA